MGVYDPLKQHLKALPSDIWDTNFSEIERIIARPLPRSAREYRPWWANQRDSNHSQSKAWREAGWEVRDIDLAHHTVRFERKRSMPGSSPTQENSDTPANGLEPLFAKAAELTGEQDRSKLMNLALNALIHREAASFFASLGGTMPEAKAAPRRRFSWRS